MNAHSFGKEDTTFSQKAVGVPGTIAGLALAHERFGRLPWRDLVMPAARLASTGVPIDRPLADSLNWVLSDEQTLSNARCEELRRVYGRPDGNRWQVGDRMLLPDLAKTLTTIADQGPAAFYRGEIARDLVAEMERGDGLISMSDLEHYRAKIRDVIRGEYRGYTILGAPPPSSGGICVVEALNILENFDLASRDRYDPITIHLIAEASRRAFADRARYLGDPDFIEVPVELTDKAYAKQLASAIDPARASSSAAIAPDIPLTDESPDTTHFSVVDADGMAVSNTYTLEASWGSRIVVKDAGFVLNNEMGDFNWFPGVTNAEGRIGTAPNTIAGGKRMLSSQSPVIVEKEGRLVLVTGSPGGRTIINTVLCILLNLIDFNQSPSQAVANVRMHHQWFPDRIELEQIDRPPHADAVEALSAMGHALQGRAMQGSAHTIAVDPESGLRTGVADYRRGGRPAPLHSKSLALWDFAEPVATNLRDVPSTGKTKRRWSSSIPGFETDGRDHLRVRSGAAAISWNTHLPLPPSSAGWSAEIKIDSARFTGEEQNERLSFAFARTPQSTEGVELNRPIATMVIGRQDADKVVLHGHADGGSIGPITLSNSNEIIRPMVLKLTLDPVHHQFSIASRDASDEGFKNHGTTDVGTNANANRFQLSVQNNLSNEGEFVDVDRIEVMASVLTVNLPRQ